MKHIKLFEAFVKTYADRIDLNKFKSIKPGTRLTYYGNSYEVKKNDGYVLTLVDDDGDTKEVNFNMFNKKGYLKEGYDWDRFDDELTRMYADIKKMGKGKFYHDFVEDYEIYYNADDESKAAFNLGKKIGAYLEKTYGVKCRVEKNDNLTTLIIDCYDWFS